jgi:uncharacterized protein with PQ loop repeat
MRELALLAGSAAAAIFVISQLPMLVKAARTKDLTSYSLANVGLANVGNVLYAVYLVRVPMGPAWAVHGFNVATSGLMLFWYLRYRRRPGAVPTRSGAGDVPGGVLGDQLDGRDALLLRRAAVGQGRDEQRVPLVLDLADTGHDPAAGAGQPAVLDERVAVAS